MIELIHVVLIIILLLGIVFLFSDRIFKTVECEAITDITHDLLGKVLITKNFFWHTIWFAYTPKQNMTIKKGSKVSVVGFRLFYLLVQEKK